MIEKTKYKCILDSRWISFNGMGEFYKATLITTRWHYLLLPTLNRELSYQAENARCGQNFHYYDLKLATPNDMNDPWGALTKVPINFNVRFFPLFKLYRYPILNRFENEISQ